MPDIVLSLTSNAGDQLGHLVRAVQMLHSYGRECQLHEFSHVWREAAGVAGQAPYVAAVVRAHTEADLEEVRQICAEVEWALGQRTVQPGARVTNGSTTASGNQPGAMHCRVVQYGHRTWAVVERAAQAAWNSLQAGGKRAGRPPRGSGREAGRGSGVAGLGGADPGGAKPGLAEPGTAAPGVEIYLTSQEFALLCRPGQRLGAGSAEHSGEQPGLDG